MIHLIYVSSATQEMSEDKLLFLLEQCRSRNMKQDVTGMLLYAGEHFFQVLEGEEKDVDEIYEFIVNDARNTGNIIIQKEKILERTFPNWSMGFKHLTSKKKATIKGYSEFLDRNMEPEEFAERPDDLLNLLYNFKENVRS